MLDLKKRKNLRAAVLITQVSAHVADLVVAPARLGVRQNLVGLCPVKVAVTLAISCRYSRY